MTLEHKTSHKGQFFEIEIYTSYESWINKLSIDVWFVMIGQYLTEKFLAMHITNQKLSFGIFMVRNLQNIITEHDFCLIS